MVEKRVKTYAIVVPGDMPANEIVKKIEKKLKINIELERITKIIPYGKGKLIT